MTLKTDPKRANQEGRTGIYVRAERHDGGLVTFASVDIAELDAVSLIRWLTDGGDVRAVKVVAIMLGHIRPAAVSGPIDDRHRYMRYWEHILETFGDKAGR